MAGKGGPLEGLVVLDLTRFLSGPYCTLLLAGMGAEVIKLDDPRTGDPTAHASPYAVDGGAAFERNQATELGLAYLKRSRGKRSATLNLKHERGRELFGRLCEDADIVVENFRPGVAERLGVGYEDLSRINPRIVYCAISGFGANGPDRHLKAFDSMAQAAVGLMAITGAPDGPPAKIGSAFADMIAGTYAALGIVSAVNERHHSGKGQAIDISMADCLFAMMMDEPFDRYRELNLEARQGNRIMRLSPFNAYQTRDGWVVIGAQSPADWRNLCAEMGRSELAEHPDFGRNEWRIANNQAVDAIVAEWVSRHGTDDVIGRLSAADIPCSPVRTMEQALQWPQLLARGMVQPLQTPSAEDTGVVAANLPLRFSRSRHGHDHPAPAPGQHTAAVFAERLGLSADEVESLRAEGVL